jgi:hypothetical protein
MHNFAAAAILTVFTATFVIAGIAPTTLVNASSCSFSSSSRFGSSSSSVQSSGGCSSTASVNQNSLNSGVGTGSSSSCSSSSAGSLEIKSGNGAVSCSAQSTTATTTEFLTFVECSGTNQNHNVHCTVHDSGITDIKCFVAHPRPTEPNGNNVGDCLTNNGIHLICVIPPQPGVFPCTRQG